jgi:DNA-directed RNA polymerase specialized sigma24 family protein
MCAHGTVTRLIDEIREANHARRDDAVRELWERFFADLTTYARRKLKSMNAPRGTADEEDAAARAFTKVCQGIERGQLNLASRVDLFKVLRWTAAREAIKIATGDRRRGRFGVELELDQIADPHPSADLLLLAFDACQRLLELLGSDELRKIAIWKQAGHSNAAIAGQLGRSETSIERKLSQIRETWRRRWVEAVPRGAPRSGPRGGSSGSVRQHGAAHETAEQDDLDELLRDLAGLPAGGSAQKETSLSN